MILQVPAACCSANTPTKLSVNTQRQSCYSTGRRKAQTVLLGRLNEVAATSIEGPAAPSPAAALRGIPVQGRLPLHDLILYLWAETPLTSHQTYHWSRSDHYALISGTVEKEARGFSVLFSLLPTTGNRLGKQLRCHVNLGPACISNGTERDEFKGYL